MPDYNCYIDEAGDDGFRLGSGSSRWFLVGAVLVRQADDLAASKCIDRIKKRLNIVPQSPVHWRKLQHPKRRVVLDELSGEPFTFCLVAFDKSALKGNSALVQQGATYFYALRLLLERVTWFVDEAGGKVDITLSHRTRVSYPDLTNYMKRLRQLPGVQIRPVISGALKPVGAGQSKMLQVADVYASAAFNALARDQYGLSDETYLMALAHQLYRRQAVCRGYGLKIFPGSAGHLQTLRSEYAWLATLGV